MAGELGLKGTVAIALGGMIGGGIYAVFGVVTQITAGATWFAFVLAGLVALCAGYSYTVLNDLADGQGGSVTFVQCFTGNTTLAGMVGWTLLFGYVGSMAMYAFAFGEFALTLAAVPERYAGLALRPVVSVLALGGFLGLNLLGARATGTVESALVALKVGILVAFGVGGIAYAYTAAPDAVVYEVERVTTFSPWMAAGVSFVAFQGWQLLFYDQESIADPIGTIRTAVYVSIPLTVGVYVLVAVAAYNLAPEALATDPHTALTVAARTMLSPLGLGSLGGAVIALSALFSTGSAINATLFSAGHFAKGMLSEGLLPDRVGDGDADGVPAKTVVGLAAVTGAFTVYGSLEAITNFASISFIVVFGAMSYLAVRERERESVRTLPPVVGAVGAGAFLPLMCWHLYRTDPRTFGMVLVLGVAAVAVELLYFERDVWAEKVLRVEELADGIGEDVRGAFDI